MRLSGCEIAVIGAGIGGIAAAIALGQRGARVTVYERAERLDEVGAGIQVGPNGVAVLEALGLRDAAERVASLPEAVVLADGLAGRTVARLPLGGTIVARYGRPYWQLHRADLLAVLAEALPAAGVTLRLGAAVETVGTGEAAAQVALPGERIVADVVVAADGVRSGVREALFGGNRPRFTGHVAWRGLVPAGGLAPEAVPRETMVWMGPGRHLVAYPLRDGRLVNIVAVEERGVWAEEGWSHRDPPAAVRAAFVGWCPSVIGLLAGLEETYLWGLFDHPALGAWVRGRVALLGDACHPMLPFLAQGATMALEDAWVLAAQLDVAARPEEGLIAYEARRKARASRVQRAAARSGRIYHLRGAARAVAHGGLGLAGRVAPAAIMARLDWLYGADVVSAEAVA
jgi:salicylate hydroxylase